jgi:hypothetical protein
MSVGLLTVLFYGYLSNSCGRRFVLMLQISGPLLALSCIVLIGKSNSYIMLSGPSAHSGARLLRRQRSS